MIIVRAKKRIIFCLQEKRLKAAAADSGDIFNYDNAVALIKKGVELTKAIRDNNTLLITVAEYNKIKI